MIVVEVELVELVVVVVEVVVVRERRVSRVRLAPSDKMAPLSESES